MIDINPKPYECFVFMGFQGLLDREGKKDDKRKAEVKSVLFAIAEIWTCNNKMDTLRSHSY